MLNSERLGFMCFYRLEIVWVRCHPIEQKGILGAELCGLRSDSKRVRVRHLTIIDENRRWSIFVSKRAIVRPGTGAQECLEPESVRRSSMWSLCRGEKRLVLWIGRDVRGLGKQRYSIIRLMLFDVTVLIWIRGFVLASLPQSFELPLDTHRQLRSVFRECLRTVSFLKHHLEGGVVSPHVQGLLDHNGTDVILYALPLVMKNFLWMRD